MKKFYKYSWLLLLPLIGCEHKKEPVEGKRIPVVDYQNTLQVDPEAKSVVVTLPSAEKLNSWSQVGYDTTHKTPHSAFPGQGRVLWTASMGSGTSSSSKLLAGPIIADGIVFAIDTHARVTAVNARTGERLWQADITPPDQDEDLIGGGLAYGDGRIYVTSPYAEVLALDAKTGQILWRQSTAGPVRAAPTFADGKVYALVINNQLEVFDAKSGKKIWNHAGITETAGLLGSASPAISKGVVITAYSSGEIFALKAENGYELWTESMTSTRRPDSLSSLIHVRALPIIDGNKVIILGHNQRMTVFDLYNGQRLWERQIGGTRTPAVAGGFIFLINNNNELVCLTEDHGQIVWVSQLPRDEKTPEKVIWSGPIIANDKLYLTGNSGQLLAFSAKTGKLQSSLDLHTSISLPPLIVGGTMYILNDNGDLIALQ